MEISPKSHIEPGAQIGADVSIGSFCFIGAHVKIGDGCRLAQGVVLEGWTTLGKNNRIQANSVLGSPPQDLKFKGEKTELILGDDNVIREFVSMNVGTTKGGAITRVGSNCLFMACSHVAHDCTVRDKVVMANNALLAGHVTVEDRAIINGAAAVNQFSTVGTLAFVGGLSRIVQDVPPFMIVEGNPCKVRGVNVVGLRRNGYREEEITALKEAHKQIFRRSLARKDVLDEMEQMEALPQVVRHLVTFLQAAQRGKQGRARDYPAEGNTR